jgi:hypothetical protein
MRETGLLPAAGSGNGRRMSGMLAMGPPCPIVTGVTWICQNMEHAPVCLLLDFTKVGGIEAKNPLDVASRARFSVRSDRPGAGLLGYNTGRGAVGRATPCIWL